MCTNVAVYIQLLVHVTNGKKHRSKVFQTEVPVDQG